MSFGGDSLQFMVNQSHNRMEIKCLDDRNIVSEECRIEITCFFADSIIPIIDIDK